VTTKGLYSSSSSCSKQYAEQSQDCVSSVQTRCISVSSVHAMHSRTTSLRNRKTGVQQSRHHAIGYCCPPQRSQRQQKHPVSASAAVPAPSLQLQQAAAHKCALHARCCQSSQVAAAAPTS
jgi:hypothetical protein